MKQEIKYYPLTSGQMILMLSQKYSMKKQVNNICATLHITNQVDESLLLQSITMALMRFPSTNCRLTVRDGKTVQYFCNEFPANIEVVDMSEATQEQIQQQIDKWGTEPFPNKGLDVPLYRVKLIRMPDGTLTMYFCILHLIMDAYALTGCIKYMEEIYLALQNGTALPEIRSTPVECYEADYAYFTSERYARDKQWWTERMTEEPVFTSPKGVDSKEFIKGKNYGITLRLWQVGADHINLRIPKEIVSAAQNYAMSKRISPQVVYLLALRSYLAKVSQTEDVMFMNTVARRATIVQKHAGGTMVNAVPFRSKIPGSTTFADALTQMYAIQRETYRHSDMPCGEILDICSKLHNVPASVVAKGYSTCSVTFQPYFSGGNGVLDFTFRREKNGAATLPFYLTIMPFDDSGDLWINYEFIVGYIKPETVHKFHDFLLKFLEQGLKNPDMTLDQLTEQAI